MNRIIVVVGICICLFAISFNAEGKIRLKTTGGIGLAFSKATEGDMLYRPFFSPHLSSGLTIPLSKRITFESGLTYSLKGFNNKFDLNHGNEVIKFRGRTRFHYVSVPLMINYRFFSKNDYQFWAGAGMDYGFFMGGTEHAKVSEYENGSLLSTSSASTPIVSSLYSSRYLSQPNRKNIQLVDAMVRLQVNCIWKDKYILGVFHNHSLHDIESKKLSDAYSVIKLRYTGFTFGIIWN